jgi:hypothetical protein
LAYENNYNTSSGTIDIEADSRYLLSGDTDEIESGIVKFRIGLETTGNSSPEVESFYVDWNEKE